MEVCPLRRHDAASVAAAFTSMCSRYCAKLDGSQQPKTVNVDVLKPDPLGGVPAELLTQVPRDEPSEGADIELPDMELEWYQPDERHGNRHGLGDRNAIRPAGRYTS